MAGKGIPMNPNHPVYIISKGRWESRLTARALDEMAVPYSIVIEPQEYEQYAAVIDPAKILTLPFSNLGQGSIPARNWVWGHALQTGAKWHWIMDDNIQRFYRVNRNWRVPVDTGAIFRCVEDFSERYENVAQAGLNYKMFVGRNFTCPAFYLNTRVYSCILLRNDLPHRWRGRYNEDTDLSLRFLKDGFCTLLVNAFVCDKMPTLTMKGGNTDEIYQDDGRLKMAQSLVDQHPDVATVTWKFNRWQHHVDYRRFKRNKLKLKPGVKIPQGVNEYGMVLQERIGDKWVNMERSASR